MRPDWGRMRRELVSHAERRAWDTADARARLRGKSRLLELAAIVGGFGIAIAVAMNKQLHGLVVAEAVVAILLVVLSQLLPLLNLIGRIRSRALRRRFPHDIVVGGYVSESIKKVIGSAGKHEELGRAAMTMSLVFTPEGVSLWLGAFAPRQVAEISWTSVRSVDTVERRNHGVIFGGLVLVSSPKVPTISFSLQPTRFFDLAVPTRQELQPLADRINVLRERRSRRSDESL